MEGGMSAAMAPVLGGERKYELFDSFEGLPPGKDIDGVAAHAWQAAKDDPEYRDNCRASEDDARAAM